ncbi:hypothetical protein F5Y17DRAFT_448139 [Xylariaceae sp. FL0594]|nr:hypothetical protein F5Y17DRAFT_448139 [Xylariaceae sp. FL0594]
MSTNPSSSEQKGGGASGKADGTPPPSYTAIDKGNPAIFKPVYFVLDDINVDLVSVAVTAISIACVAFLRFSPVKTLSAAALILAPLRTFFPRSTKPEGLALVTGASSGIGAELTYILAGQGHDLILVGRNEDQLEAVKGNVLTKVGKTGVTCHTIALDLSVPGAPKELYDRVAKTGLTVDVLVNGAGLGAAGETLEQPIELTERMTYLNCIAPVQLAQLFGRDMARRGRGWMLHISSVGGWMASPHQNLYHASKHYVRAFSEALSLELRAYPGVVNCQLMPGPTHTQFITRAHAQEVTMMANPGAVEDPKAVALAGYNGLCRGKRMIFSSWNAAGSALLMQFLPRSVHLTLASFANAPLRGWARAVEPEKDQNVRGRDL